MNQIKRALIADDVLFENLFLKRMLESLGIETDYVLDGEEVLDILRQNSTKYDIIFLDMHMENSSGLDTAQQIKNMGLDLPLILTSGEGQEEACKKLFFDVLIKPYEKRDLMRILDGLEG